MIRLVRAHVGPWIALLELKNDPIHDPAQPIPRLRERSLTTGVTKPKIPRFRWSK